MSTSTQVKLIKLKFRCNKFGKTAMLNAETKIFLEKSHLTKLMKSMTNLSKRIPNVTFNFILRQETWKYNIVTNIRDLHMRRCLQL